MEVPIRVRLRPGVMPGVLIFRVAGLAPGVFYSLDHVPRELRRNDRIGISVEGPHGNMSDARGECCIASSAYWNRRGKSVRRTLQHLPNCKAAHRKAGHID